MPAFTTASLLALGGSILGGAATAAGGAAVAAAADHFFVAPGRDKAAQEAKDLAAGAQVKQDTVISDEKTRIANQESTDASNVARDQARSRQRAMAAGAGGRRSTLLTSPLGIQGDSAAGSVTPKKTLLGA